MYDDWRGAVYPSELPKSKWLAYYATLFDSVEVNNSFYRLPNVDTVAAWAAAVPADFTFSMKLGAFGSHRMKLKDPVGWLKRHTETFEPFTGRRGACLVQLPPRWRVNVQRLDEFLDAAPANWRWAVEMREPSWLCDAVFDVLHRHDAALCVHDLLADHPQLLTTNWTYVRFHGPNARERRYTGRYGTRRMRKTATWLERVLHDGNDVYAYFNNDYNGDAIRDARTLRRLLTRSD
jgi:uncharacterized protein YecE (DUF72 family)